MKNSKPDSKFDQFLETFPPSERESLQTMQKSGGMLSAEHCLTFMESFSVSAEDLMLRLLPVAKLYSTTEISNFQVGAVIKAGLLNNSDDFALFLGANIEFKGQSLTQTIHAEQAAVINAWLHGARQIDTLAVTEAPCGCCRQFLYELDGSHKLSVILQTKNLGGVTKYNLSELLPLAFGPHDLKPLTGLMASANQQPELSLQLTSDDPIVLEAKAAAKKSYAPYSQNMAGCAIEASNSKIYAGRYAENAAFNPSLSPLHTAIICMNMDNFDLENKITRAVLVERPTSISQRTVCELLLQTVAPNVNLEYFEAV